MASTSAAEGIMQSSAKKQHRNWADMPDELMTNILQRLGTRDLFDCPLKVCRNWRRICKDPAWWKVIYVYKSFDDSDDNYDYEKLTKQAVDLSCGELIDISIEYFGSDNLLDHIVLRSNKLKRLCLVHCFRMTIRGFIQAVKRVPQLEKLSLSYMWEKAGCIEAIAQNCPQLKSLKICSYGFDFGAEITNHGLHAIKNGCPHLESLDVRGCHNLNFNGILGKRCREQIKDCKHD